MSPAELDGDALRRLVAWLVGSHTGASSKAIVSRLLLGYAEPTSIPYDAGDLGRCVGLLRAVPELRPHLHLMRDVHPVWAAVVDDLPRLERLLADRAGRAVVYAFLTDALDGAR